MAACRRAWTTAGRTLEKSTAGKHGHRRRRSRWGSTSGLRATLHPSRRARALPCRTQTHCRCWPTPTRPDGPPDRRCFRSGRLDRAWLRLPSGHQRPIREPQYRPLHRPAASRAQPGCPPVLLHLSCHEVIRNWQHGVRGYLDRHRGDTCQTPHRAEKLPQTARFVLADLTRSIIPVASAAEPRPPGA